MAKPFLIHLYVDRFAAIDTIERIKKIPGFAGYELPALLQHKPKSNGEARDSRPRGPLKQYPITGQELVIKTLAGKPPMTTAQLRDAFVSQDRATSSINSVLHNMIKAGEVKTTPDGYTLTKLVRDRLRRTAGKKTRR